MNMKKRGKECWGVVFALCLLGAGLSAGAVTAEEMPPPERKPSIMGLQQDADHQNVEWLKKKLDLTAEQEKAVRKIYDDARDRREALRKSLDPVSARGYLDAAPDSPEFEKGYRKEAEILSKLVNDRVLSMGEARKKVYQLLTDEQKKKFMELKHQHRPVMQRS
jgi:Spy/CpxP family protein refolding chaperone